MASHTAGGLKTWRCPQIDLHKTHQNPCEKWFDEHVDVDSLGLSISGPGFNIVCIWGAIDMFFLPWIHLDVRLDSFVSTQTWRKGIAKTWWKSESIDIPQMVVEKWWWMNPLVESVTNHPKTQKTDCGGKILYGAMARKLDYVNLNFHLQWCGFFELWM